ncbi:MAG: peptide chain release factor N(5)-glutamine methyltransferase [Lachnospiraceae bacterium]|nr:peptide chain release factor N(5)-glutamine methyltransferase [Lachnospiraceae bacterium]
MTYREAIDMGEQMLKEQGIADAKTDAWLLLAMACKIDRNFYYLHMNEEILEEQKQEYASVLKKRAEHIPLHYITGEQEFMGHRFLVNSNVLIPRQDTEVLVEEAIKRVKPGMDVLDMCTGSGCIIISILKNVSDVNAIAADVSKQALIVAKENAKLNEVSVRFETSDLFDHIKGEFDIIVSNPPYIRTEEITKLMPEVRDFEPFNALDGKEDGLYFYRKIVDEGKKYLKPGGYLMFEIGYDQGEEVVGLMRQAGYSEIKVVKDLAGLDRVVIGKGK